MSLEIATKNGHSWITLETHLAQQRKLFLFTDVEEYISRQLVTAMYYLDNLSHEPITLYINSPGGYISSGLAIYDAMRQIESPVHTVCTGEACSMGAVILAGGDYRASTPNARIMIHQAASGTYGKTSEVKVHARELERVEKLINEILSKHTGHTVKKLVSDQRNDFYMSPEEAKKYNLIDTILIGTK